MADSTPTTTPSKQNESCSFQRTVSLYDWWLIKAKNDFQEKRLAVAGVSSRKDEAMRVFVSAPVIRRYDVFSLETADGKCVIISGFINEQRTLENGFAPEVFNRFLFGFPPNWESYALDCFREESTSGTDLCSDVPDNVSDSCPEILSDGVEKSIPTSLVSPGEAPGDHEKPFPENECNVSKEMGGVNVACSSGRKRRSARLHDKVCQQKQQPASGSLLKHPDNENSTSVTLENCDVEGQTSLATPFQSQSWSEYSNSACVENSIPASLASPEEAPGDDKMPFPENECNVSKEMGGVNIACSSGGNRRSARLYDIKVCQQKKPHASGGPPKHPDNENSTSVALENCDVEGLKSPATPIQSQSWRQLSTSPEQLVKNLQLLEHCHQRLKAVIRKRE
ncbi:SANT associated [Spatholobus suberectus]|nr:SANT associated [Spatholobus suberectus]